MGTQLLFKEFFYQVKTFQDAHKNVYRPISNGPKNKLK